MACSLVCHGSQIKKFTRVLSRLFFNQCNVRNSGKNNPFFSFNRNSFDDNRTRFSPNKERSSNSMFRSSRSSKQIRKLKGRFLFGSRLGQNQVTRDTNDEKLGAQDTVRNKYYKRFNVEEILGLVKLGDN